MLPNICQFYNQDQVTIFFTFSFIIFYWSLKDFHFDRFRLKPVHKIEGMTNGTAGVAGQQQQQQQGPGHVDISTQVQHYQQFLGEYGEQSYNTRI